MLDDRHTEAVLVLSLLFLGVLVWVKLTCKDTKLEHTTKKCAAKRFFWKG